MIETVAQPSEDGEEVRDLRLQPRRHGACCDLRGEVREIRFDVRPDGGRGRGRLPRRRWLQAARDLQQAGMRLLELLGPRSTPLLGALDEDAEPC